MSPQQNGSRRRTATAAVTIAALAVIAVVAFWPRPTTATAPAAGPHAGHGGSSLVGTPAVGTLTGDAKAAPLTPPTDSAAPGTAPETSLAAAASAPVGVAAKAAASAASAASGASPSGRTLGTPRPDVKPDDVLGVSESLGGCLPDYGETGQCLPTVPPSQAAHVQAMIDAGIDPSTMRHDWSCAEVRNLFPAGLAVRGDDSQALDRDRDGTACGPTD